jgi:sugar phosphate isomerase/epimerase
MIRSAITTSLVPEAQGGPFVFWDGLPAAFSRAAELGFDAVEIFAPGPQAVDPHELTGLLDRYQLQVAAVGTGAGMVKHGLSLTDPVAERRLAARDFIQQMIDFGGRFAAPAIIGSMQGRWGGELSRDQAVEFLAEALEQLAPHAARYGVPLLFEPLNRYETNLIKSLSDGVALTTSLKSSNVRLLADMFHMNIEESDIAAAIRSAGRHIGHVHFVDSNRLAVGLGHIAVAPIAQALRDVDFAGFVSAEALPLPSSEVAASKTIESFRHYFR